MRNLALGLIVVALVGFATSTALAAHPGPAQSLGSSVQLVAHHGSHGFHHGWHHPRIYHPRPMAHYPGRVIVRPQLYPYGAYYYGYPYYYGPRSSFQYYGPGGGISIGW